MACAIYKGLDGTERRVPMGVAHRIALGEVYIGVDLECAATEADKQRVAVIKESATVNQIFDELDKELGSGAGDWIKRFAQPIAKLLGKKGCSSCETRRLVVNAYAQLKTLYGTVEAIKIMKELWQASFNEQDDVVIDKLKAYLG